MIQFTGNGPYLPTEILRAQEEESLVIFCGAGVSIGTGLPSFKGLVEKVCGSLGIVPTTKTEKIHRSFKLGEYDRVLHHLEGIYDRRLIRERVAEILGIPPTDPTLPVHQALLRLAKLRSNSGHRIVTTNFDNRFQLALDSKHQFESAPALGPARQESFRRIVYLHGRIDHLIDPSHEQLVLTSADFGTAYLRDAWAARFSVEMFREFTVLFVGYSVNDVILRYLIDAISTAKRFKRAYAFAEANKGKESFVRQDWREKGIEPIIYRLYSRSINPHRILDETLKKWAVYYASGLGSRISAALEKMRSPYRDDLPVDDVRMAISALSKEDGSVAKALANEEPSPSVSWLQAILETPVTSTAGEEEYYLLSSGLSVNIREPSRTKNRIVGRFSNDYGRPLSKVEFQICRWLVKHLNSHELVAWVVANDGILSTEFRRLIEDKIRPFTAASKQNPALRISEPIRQFWTLVIDGHFQAKIIDTIQNALKFNSDLIYDESQFEWFLQYISPRLTFRKNASLFGAASKTEIDEITNIDIGFQDEFDDSRSYKFYGLKGFFERNEDKFRRSIERLTDHLLQAARLASMANATYIHKWSSSEVRDVWIFQEERIDSAVHALVFLFSETMKKLIAGSPSDVVLVFQRLFNFYQKIDSDLIARIILCIAREAEYISIDLLFDCISLNQWALLWSHGSRQELRQVLARRSSEFSDAQKEKIFTALLERIDGTPETSVE
jgi:hypothetical protein